MRICGSVPLIYGFGFGSGSASCFFRQWLTRCQQNKSYFFKKILRTGITFWRYICISLQIWKVKMKSKNKRNQVVSYFFCLSMEASRPVQIMTDPFQICEAKNIRIHNTAYHSLSSKFLYLYFFHLARVSFFGHARSQYYKVVVAFWTRYFLQGGCQVISLRGGGGGGSLPCSAPFGLFISSLKPSLDAYITSILFF